MNHERYDNPRTIGIFFGLILFFGFYNAGQGVGSNASFTIVEDERC
jgi:hypothetical protein